MVRRTAVAHFAVHLSYKSAGLAGTRPESHADPLGREPHHGVQRGNQRLECRVGLATSEGRVRKPQRDAGRAGAATGGGGARGACGRNRQRPDHRLCRGGQERRRRRLRRRSASRTVHPSRRLRFINCPRPSRSRPRATSSASNRVGDCGMCSPRRAFPPSCCSPPQMAGGEPRLQTLNRGTNCGWWRR